MGHAFGTQTTGCDAPNAETGILAGFVDEDGLARELKKARRTILRWRAKGFVFPSIQLGGKRYYSVQVVRNFLLGQINAGAHGRRTARKTRFANRSRLPKPNLSRDPGRNGNVPVEAHG
jgi:hypothetical protein